MFCLRNALYDGNISFLDCTVYKLLLQQAVGFHRLRNDNQSRGLHVEPMNGHRSGPAFLCPGGYGGGICLSWHTQHPCRFIEHSHRLVFIDDGRFLTGALGCIRMGIDIQSL